MTAAVTLERCSTAQEMVSAVEVANESCLS
jgi:hypothetical protein